jgi:hypothetical protein
MTGVGESGMSRSRFRLFAICGVILVCISCCVVAPCLNEVRDGEAWTHSGRNLKIIALAMHNYLAVNGRLPPTAIRGQKGEPLLSWHVVLLPYLEEDPLYKEFHLEEPWDSPHNKRFAEKTPRCYTPFWVGHDPPGLTRYQVFVGPGTAFEHDGLTWADFPDGLDNTLLVVEAGEPVPWSKPTDLNYHPDQPVAALGGVFRKSVKLWCYTVGSRPGFSAAFADGSSRFIDGSINDGTLRALITRNGGEPVDLGKMK